MDDPACTVDSARINDIPSMLEFEKVYFDSCWQSKYNILQKLIEKDPMMFRLCKVDGVIKGYYGIIPLPFEVWQKVLQGEINEDEAMRYVLSFDAPKIYLYIYSVIVDLSDKQHKIYTRALIRDFARQYIFEPGYKRTNICALGAFTVSDGGRRMMERSNFAFRGRFCGKNGKYVRTYTIDYKNLIRQAKANGQRHQRHIA